MTHYINEGTTPNWNELHNVEFKSESEIEADRQRIIRFVALSGECGVNNKRLHNWGFPDATVPEIMEWAKANGLSCIQCGCQDIRWLNFTKA